MRYIALFVVISAFLSSCTINNSVLLKTDKEYVFDSIPTQLNPEYQLSANDAIRFRLFANDGFQLIEFSSIGGSRNSGQALNQQVSFTYILEYDGFVKLPIIGRTNLSGLTIREAEIKLQELYSEYYNSPFVMLSVANRRVVVFPGNAGGAQVITLTENNTTLLEAIAMAGGLAERGRARSIRLIREEAGERKVYNIDLSTIEGLKYIDIIVEANDVIYVEPVPNIAQEVLKDIAPVFSIISSAFFIWVAVTRGV